MWILIWFLAVLVAVAALVVGGAVVAGAGATLLHWATGNLCCALIVAAMVGVILGVLVWTAIESSWE